MKDYKDMCNLAAAEGIHPDLYIDEKTYEKLSFKSYITERLRFTNKADFLRQLKANNCNLLDYSSYSNGDKFVLIEKVLDVFSTGDTLAEKILNFNKFLEKYSYRFSRIIRTPNANFIEIVPENYLIKPHMGFKNLYIHFSPADELDIKGIRAKSSRDVELDHYDYRVYLFPLYPLVDDAFVDLSDENAIFDTIYRASEQIVQSLNRGKNKRLSFWVYSIDLSKANMQIYKDPQYTMRNAVYVKNFIKSEFVEKIGRIR